MKKVASLVLALSVLASALPAHAIRESGGRRAPLAVEIVFTSVGAGIDREAKKAIFALIKQDRASGKIVHFQERNWGREGESTVCVEYAKFQDAHQADVEIGKVLAEARQPLTSHKRKLSCSDNVVVLPNE